MQLSNLLGMAVLVATLVLFIREIRKQATNGIPVFLSHRCSQQEEMHRGDGREIFVRCRRDHSSFVNRDLMPVEEDLRRSVRSSMATRHEQVIFVSGDNGLEYQDVLRVLSDLKEDDPDMYIVLLTTTQMLHAEQVCLPSVN